MQNAQSPGPKSSTAGLFVDSELTLRGLVEMITQKQAWAAGLCAVLKKKMLTGLLTFSRMTHIDVRLQIETSVTAGSDRVTHCGTFPLVDRDLFRPSWPRRQHRTLQLYEGLLDCHLRTLSAK